MSASQKLIFKSGQINQARRQVELDLPLLHSAKKKKESQAPPPRSEEENQYAESLEEQEISAYKKAESEEYDEEYKEDTSDFEHEKKYRKEKLDEELDSHRQKRMAEIELEIEEQQKRVEDIKKGNESMVFGLAQEAKEKSKKEITSARSEAEQITERAKLEVERMLKEAEMRVSEIEHEAYQKGYDAGREVGYKSGEAESHRLINRLGAIIGRAAELRQQLISDSEKQMVDMVLIIARKIIKDEITERKAVVLNNIRESLKRVKDRDRIDIRVNFADLDLTAAHKDELIKMMESLRKVNIYEDTRIERGGCIIETDIGSIDARISTQLNQIEEAIRNVEPF